MRRLVPVHACRDLPSPGPDRPRQAVVSGLGAAVAQTFAASLTEASTRALEDARATMAEADRARREDDGAPPPDAPPPGRPHLIRRYVAALVVAAFGIAALCSPAA